MRNSSNVEDLFLEKRRKMGDEGMMLILPRLQEADVLSDL